ncbi:hypothetical protein TYRP_020821 [Tyrophagus putrescentiae]|nr:hypothetical protein TYRP_020821 [Tyrophagus putrescentiae]
MASRIICLQRIQTRNLNGNCPRTIGNPGNDTGGWQANRTSTDEVQQMACWPTTVRSNSATQQVDHHLKLQWAFFIGNDAKVARASALADVKDVLRVKLGVCHSDGVEIISADKLLVGSVGGDVALQTGTTHHLHVQLTSVAVGGDEKAQLKWPLDAGKSAKYGSGGNEVAEKDTERIVLVVSEQGLADADQLLFTQFGRQLTGGEANQGNVRQNSLVIDSSNAQL